MTRIGLIRHGTTLWNTERRAQGQTDIPLNEIGRLQAQALANRLLYEGWEYIFSSDLLRAVETAEIIARFIGKEVHTDIRLREMYKGKIEGTTLEERINKWGIEWEKSQLQLGIEDEHSIIQRGLSFINEVIDDLKGKRILIVSHGALIETILNNLIPKIHLKGPIDNTSITVINNNDSDWNCELLNCVEHLEGLIKVDVSI
jgi:probable phosphoglycerate mutase